MNDLRNSFKQMSPRNKFLGLVTAVCAAGMLAVTAPKNDEKIPEMTDEEFFETSKKYQEMFVQALESMSNNNRVGLDKSNELLEKIQKKCKGGVKDFDLENLKQELED